jgi:hypothetical protein
MTRGPRFVVRVTLTPPSGNVTKFTLHYGVIVDELVTHKGARRAEAGKERTHARRGRLVVHERDGARSLTLAAAAFGLVNVPSHPVEALIALSIAVSAAHALRPLVRGGETKIAFSFGLVHGLAFAEVLRGLGLRGTDLVLSLLGFNVGIELTQLLILALLMPSLCVLARHRVRCTRRMLSLPAAPSSSPTSALDSCARSGSPQACVSLGG